MLTLFFLMTVASSISALGESDMDGSGFLVFFCGGCFSPFFLTYLLFLVAFSPS